MTLDKIAFGFNLAVRDLEAVSSGNPAYVKSHMDEFGGKEKVYHPLARIGGVFAWLRHPIMFYNAVVNYPKK